MGHGIDELARMERIRRDLADQSRVPGEAGASAPRLRFCATKLT